MFKNRKEEILTPYRLVEEEGKGKGERGGVNSAFYNPVSIAAPLISCRLPPK